MIPPITPEQMFSRAQQAWSARPAPRYESFDLACSVVAQGCADPDVVRFVMRLSDGKTYATFVSAKDGSARVWFSGGKVTGPSYTPFGFYRRIGSSTVNVSPPSNLAPDPFATPLPTIATVTAIVHAYDVTDAGEEAVNGFACRHLALTPIDAPDRYPLRDLWVRESDYQIVRLNYVRPRDGSYAIVTYTFAPVGPDAVWTVVHVDAAVPIRTLFWGHTDHASFDLKNISFPATEPDQDFL